MPSPVFQRQSVDRQPRFHWETHSLCSNLVLGFCHIFEALGLNGRRSWQHHASDDSFAFLGSCLSRTHTTEFDQCHDLTHSKLLDGTFLLHLPTIHVDEIEWGCGTHLLIGRIQASGNSWGNSHSETCWWHQTRHGAWSLSNLEFTVIG